MEIKQAKPVPQAASTGSTGASAVVASGSETGNDDFLSLMNNFMGVSEAGDGGGSETASSGLGAQGQGTQGQGASSTIPDGMLSLIAQGFFPNLIVQPQQAATGDAPPPAEDAAIDPLAALPPGQIPGQIPGQLQAPAQPGPGLPAKGLGAQPGQGEPAADSGEPIPDAEAGISEEDLAKLVAEGKAKIEARQGKQAPQSSAQQPPAQQPSTLQSSAQAEQSKAPASQEPTTRTDIPVPVAATVQVVREPAPAGLRAGSRSGAEDLAMTKSVSPDEQAAPATDGDIPLTSGDAASDGSADENAQTGADTSGQEGQTNGSRQAQQHAARIEKANERPAEQPVERNASSAQSAGVEAETRGGAALRTAAGSAGDDGKPGVAKERGAEAGPGFEDVLAKAKPAHKEPEADGSLGVQTAAHGPAEAEAAERAAAPHGRSAVQHSAADQVSVQLGKAVPGKNDQMVINLKPVELGSVEVKLDFGADGRVQASIMAERPETLEMLQKDYRALERALNDAGLQTDPGSLSFNLKGQNQGGNQRQFAGYNQPGGGRGKGFAGMDIEGPAIPDFAAPQYSASGANRNRLDIRI
ncbi:MAG TPA: flagellar hook-length control protein FliK [Skermanella sp.]|nr:flagellar hook-length control protein FliK [Skermanella sp.]